MTSNGPADFQPIMKFCTVCRQWNPSVRIFIKIEAKAIVNVVLKRVSLNAENDRWIWMVHRKNKGPRDGEKIIIGFLLRIGKGNSIGIMQIGPGIAWGDHGEEDDLDCHHDDSALDYLLVSHGKDDDPDYDCKSDDPDYDCKGDNPDYDYDDTALDCRLVSHDMDDSTPGLNCDNVHDTALGCCSVYWADEHTTDLGCHPEGHDNDDGHRSALNCHLCG